MKPQPSFIHLLQILLEKTKRGDEMKVGEIFDILSTKRYAALFVVLSFPFCIPIQIPGFSTPFGIVLSFLGLRLAFAKHPWWPSWILERKIKSEHVKNLAEKTIQAIRSIQKVVHPRLTILTQYSITHRIHGVLVFMLSLLLLLPLPIPFTNMLSAIPIFLIGIGLLEDDGLCIIFAYIIAFLCFLAFFGLILFGKMHLTNFFVK